MKQAILTFEKQSVLLVELPEGAYGVGQQHIYHGEDPITYHIEGNGDRNYGFKFPGFVELIGKLSELTEDQARQIVDSWQRYFPEQHTVYRNYEKPTEYDAIKRSSEQKWDEPFGKAVESFLSKLRAEGCHTENPHGYCEGVEGRPKYWPDGKDFNTPIELYNAQKKWDKAEVRTFRPEQTYLFKIVKQ